MKKKYDKQFKIDAVKYVSEHKELSLEACAKNLGISYQSIYRWQKQYNEDGDITHIVSGNYSSAEAKETARLNNTSKDRSFCKGVE